MRSTRCRLSSAALALALVLTLGRAARGQEAPSEQEMKAAQQAYADGEAAYKLGKYDDAAKEFEQAYRIIKFPTMLFDIAQAYRRAYEKDQNLEKLRKAVDVYRAFLHDAPTARQRSIAEKLIPELEKIIVAASRHQREVLIAKAIGREGLFLADQLLSENAASDAALVLDRVLATHGNPRDVLVGAYEKRGQVAGTLGDQTGAIEWFKRALTLDRGFLLPESAEPATKRAFATAEKALAGTRPFELSQVPPGDLAKSQAVKITIRVESDPLALASQLAVYYRRSGGGAFSVTRANKTAGAVEVPAAFIASLRGGSKVEYYLAATDATDGELATLGTPQEPFIFAVAADPDQVALTNGAAPEKPTYKKWWVWTLVAAVAVAGGVGVGIYFGTRPPANNPPAVQIPSPLHVDK